MHVGARNMTQTALCTAFLCVLSQISIPMPWGVPLTLQTLAVALIGCLLGAKGGALCAAMYILLGAVGMPVFSGLGAGFSRVIGPTGGFMIGFVPMAALCGLSVARPGARAYAMMGLGLAVCHLAGVAQFALVTGRGISEAFALASAPYLVKDALSLAGARALARTIQKRVAFARRA